MLILKVVYKVAYITRAQSDSFAAWLANVVKDETKKYPNIKLNVFDGQANDDKENSMIENAITNKYDLVIVQPNSGESQRPYVEKVVNAGIFAIREIEVLVLKEKQVLVKLEYVGICGSDVHYFAHG